MEQTSLTQDDIKALLNANVLTDFETHDNSQGFVNPTDFQSKAWLKHNTTTVYAGLGTVVVEGWYNNSELEPKNILSEVLGFCNSFNPTATDLAHKALADALNEIWPKLSSHSKISIQSALKTK